MRQSTLEELLAAMPTSAWVTTDWVRARQEGMTNYVAKQLLGNLYRNGWVDRGELDGQGRRLYCLNGKGRLRLVESRQEIEKRLVERERWKNVPKRSPLRQETTDYERRLAAFETRKREGL